MSLFGELQRRNVIKVQRCLRHRVVAADTNCRRYPANVWCPALGNAGIGILSRAWAPCSDPAGLGVRDDAGRYQSDILGRKKHKALLPKPGND